MRVDQHRDHGYRIPEGWVPLSGPRIEPDPMDGDFTRGARYGFGLTIVLVALGWAIYRIPELLVVLAAAGVIAWCYRKAKAFDKANGLG